MNLFYKLLSAVIFLPLLSLAQTNFVPGVAVNLNGDTLHGFIDYRKWELNPTSIKFKKADSSIIKLDANDTKFFSLNIGPMAEYQRYIGKISMDQTEIDHLSNGRDTSFRIDAVFLNVLQKGKNITLLSLSDSFKTRFFIEETGSENVTELVYRIYWGSDISNGSSRTAYENTYQKQLYASAIKFNAANDKLASYIGKSEYKEADLLNIAGKINNLSEKDRKKNNPSKSKPFTILVAIAGSALILFILIMEFATVKTH